MKRLSFSAGLLGVLLLASCGNKNKESAGAFPAGFDSMGDTGRVAYVMKNATPDSVARFILRAALGELEGARIDSLGIVTNYVYSNYSSDDQIVFGDEYDKQVSAMSLSKRMRLYALGGVDDPQGLGYELGLNYLSEIRDRNMSVEDVKREIQEFRKACGNDSATYRRFVTGFTTVLKVDSGKDVRREIYDSFVNLQAD